MNTGCRYMRIVVVSLLAFWVTSAGASPPEDPQEHFNRAVELAKAGKYDEAVGLCLNVLEDLPEPERPRVHKLLGFAYRKLDQRPEAWHHLSMYLQSTGKADDAIREWLGEVEEQLKGTHIKVTLTCDSEGVSLGVKSASSNLQPVYDCPLTWWFEPGKRQVLAGKTGHQPRTVEITVLKLGDKGVHKIHYPAETKPPTKVTKTGDGGKEPTVIVQPAPPAEPNRTLEWSLIASGAALGAAGAVFQLMANSKNDDLHAQYLDSSEHPYGPDAKALYDDAYDEEVSPKLTTAYVLYGLGAAALGGGIVAWMLDEPKQAAGRPAPMAITPLAFPGGSGAMMTLEW